MSRVPLIFEITFKIHYAGSLERSWKSSMWRNSQTPPVATFSALLLDLCCHKLAALQPVAAAVHQVWGHSVSPSPSWLPIGVTTLPISLTVSIGRSQRAHQANKEAFSSLLRPGEAFLSKGKDSPQEICFSESHKPQTPFPAPGLAAELMS